MSYQPPNNDPYQQLPPNTYYPPQQPPINPRRRKLPTSTKIILAIIGSALVLSCILSRIATTATLAPVQATPTSAAIAPTATDTPVPTDTPTPTKPLTWTVTHTFSGNGSKKTSVFSVPDDWKIVWSCTPSSFGGIDYNMIVDVYNSDASFFDGAINSTCSKTNTHDQTEEHQSGNVYLDITSEGSWKIEVQELQ